MPYHFGTKNLFTHNTWYILRAYISFTFDFSWDNKNMIQKFPGKN